MFPNENDEKRTVIDIENIPMNETENCEPSLSQPVYNESTHNETVYAEPVYSEPVYTAPVYNESVYTEPQQSQPVYIEPVVTESQQSQPVYIEPAPAPPPPQVTVPPANAPIIGEQPGTQWPVYSPGICVNQPYPRVRGNTVPNSRAPRSSRSKLGGFLRAVCLVIVCALFSAAATYVVMDFRFQRGDFTINNHVVLGASTSESRQDVSVTSPVATYSDGMTAQDIYDMACTQVVGINTESPDYFGSSGSRGTVSPVSGSGFIISDDGYILTNYHVIELAHENNLPISVVLNDGTSYPATVVGFEASSDVAVIKIAATGLNPAMIGNSDLIRVGQTIYAIGNPFGDLVYTMTDGIVSALDRVVSVDRKSISTFQFSAAVNSGNSGGPIYDTDGKVIGIVTAKVIRGNVEGIGFAIPINDAINIATELIENGYISGRPLIGITGQTVTPGHAEYYGWVVGTYIRSVNADSAAEKAGIVIGDIITAIDGNEVESMEALKFALRSHKAGDTTSITIWRNGESIDLTITFDEDMLAGQPQRPPLPDPDSPNPFEDYP